MKKNKDYTNIKDAIKSIIIIVLLLIITILLFRGY